ncbi:GNAT family N-acetyltransferase [sulfur-oxidizing endosymbiont of Gigantopelta aegis]|uniref:GNAT family N-acetyltransferase n=1 Tax=sulfur-oxidizing endosymbiont of Gigantopelta aegis TaxID=2794934 RepID=UPI0018DDFA56|nr:GNAT family protein [sulfur-oxidizing endosymbiont of Gigantopelta aegis]
MQNSTLSFRQATSSDLEAILNFPQDKTELFYFFPSASYPLTQAQLEAQLSERYESTVMLDLKLAPKQQVIGFANFYNVENHNIAFIGNVIIKPEKRQQGLGKKLVQTMVAIGFQQLGLNEVHLSCYSQNTKALLFYQHLGFKPYAIEQRKDFNQQSTAMIHFKIKRKAFLATFQS